MATEGRDKNTQFDVVIEEEHFHVVMNFEQLCKNYPGNQNLNPFVCEI